MAGKVLTASLGKWGQPAASKALLQYQKLMLWFRISLYCSGGASQEGTPGRMRLAKNRYQYTAPPRSAVRNPSTLWHIKWQLKPILKLVLRSVKSALNQECSACLHEPSASPNNAPKAVHPPPPPPPSFHPSLFPPPLRNFRKLVQLSTHKTQWNG